MVSVCSRDTRPRCTSVYGEQFLSSFFWVRQPHLPPQSNSTEGFKSSVLRLPPSFPSFFNNSKFTQRGNEKLVRPVPEEFPVSVQWIHTRQSSSGSDGDSWPCTSPCQQCSAGLQTMNTSESVDRQPLLQSIRHVTNTLVLTQAVKAVLLVSHKLVHYLMWAYVSTYTQLLLLLLLLLSLRIFI